MYTPFEITKEEVLERHQPKKERSDMEVFFPIKHRNGEPFFYHHAVRWCRERGLTLTRANVGYSGYKELQLAPPPNGEFYSRWHYQEGRVL